MGATLHGQSSGLGRHGRIRSCISCFVFSSESWLVESAVRGFVGASEEVFVFCSLEHRQFTCPPAALSAVALSQLPRIGLAIKRRAQLVKPCKNLLSAPRGDYPRRSKQIRFSPGRSICIER